MFSAKDRLRKLCHLATRKENQCRLRHWWPFRIHIWAKSGKTSGAPPNSSILSWWEIHWRRAKANWIAWPPFFPWCHYYCCYWKRPWRPRWLRPLYQLTFDSDLVMMPFFTEAFFRPFASDEIYFDSLQNFGGISEALRLWSEPQSWTMWVETPKRISWQNYFQC